MFDKFYFLLKWIYLSNLFNDTLKYFFVWRNYYNDSILDKRFLFYIDFFRKKLFLRMNMLILMNINNVFNILFDLLIIDLIRLRNIILFLEENESIWKIRWKDGNCNVSCLFFSYLQLYFISLNSFQHEYILWIFYIYSINSYKNKEDNIFLKKSSGTLLSQYIYC